MIAEVPCALVHAAANWFSHGFGVKQGFGDGILVQ
jgi:hypothetical protein